jgi:hypothetical protein
MQNLWSSISKCQASAETNIERTTLMRHLKDPKQTYCYYVIEQIDI